MEAGEYTSPTAASNGSGQSPWDAHDAAQTSAHPEIPVIAAFVGGFILAKLIGKLGGDDD
jgi:hypothetical protein